MKIVLISHTPIGGAFAVGSHHYAESFAKMGHDVLHITNPSPKNFFRRRISGKVFKVCNPATLFSYKLLRLLFPGSIKAHFKKPILLRRCDRSFVEEFRDAELVLIDVVRGVGLLEYFKSALVLYRPTDVYPLMSGDIFLERLEEQLLERVWKVVATSLSVRRHILSLNNSIDCIVVENGVDNIFFEQSLQWRKSASKDTLSLVYVGAVDSRFDFEMAEQISKLPKVELVVAGPLPQKAVNEKYPGINFIGPQAYCDLPRFLSGFDAGLLLFNEHPANSGRSPMKLFEYLSAGLPAIAPDYCLKWYEFQFLLKYRSFEDLKELLRQVKSQPFSPLEISDFASSFGWNSKSKKILEYAFSED